MDAKWHAHRLAWVLVHGDIPDGLAIGHARDQGYRFPNYIRIDHLSAVIPAESMRRWMPPTAVSARTGESRRGLHAMTEANISTDPRTGYRRCRE